MNVIISFTAHHNGVLVDVGNGRVFGCIGDYVRVDSDGLILDDGVHLCSQVLLVGALGTHV